jgi:pre-mRNA-splicing factor ATP-dependent RNA helicase DHX15/PRP43
MKKLGVEDLVHFDFVEPPAPETLMRALELLNYLKALDDDGRLTAIGDKMSAFPVEPEMAAALLHSPEYRCGDEMARICAMMSVQNPFLHNPKDFLRCSRAKEKFYHQTGDHLALLATFNAFEDHSHSTEWATQNFLNHRAMRQAVSVYHQLLGIMKRLGLSMTSDPTQDPQFANHIRRAILRGFFTKVAMALPTKNQYLTLKDDVKCLLFPSTFLNRRPQFVVFNELVLTSNTYIRTVTAVSDDWLIEACPEYFDLEEFDGVSRQVFEQLVSRQRAAEPRRSSGKRARERDGDSD